MHLAHALFVMTTHACSLSLALARSGSFSLSLVNPRAQVHTTSESQPHMQYAGCQFKNTTRRGPFGDALAEVDWIIGNVVSTLETNNIDKNTL